MYIVDGNSWTDNVFSWHASRHLGIPRKEESFHPGVLKPNTPKPNAPKPTPRPSTSKPSTPKPSTDTKIVLPPPQTKGKDDKHPNVATQKKPSRLSLPDPSNCHTTGPGMKAATVDVKTTATLQAFNLEGKLHTEAIGSLECTVVSLITGMGVSCNVGRKEQNQYEISYRPIFKGGHHLSITIGGRHVRASPFSVQL